MQVSTQTVTALCIKPSGLILPLKLVFDQNINQPLISINQNNFPNICENMKLKNNCHFNRKNIAKAIHPNETYYHIFYEYNAPHSNALFNKIATHLANSYVDTSEVTRDVMCYGNCYVIHFDSRYQLYDVASDTFVNLYNKVHTFGGKEEREYTKRVYKQKGSTNIYCLYGDFGVIEI